jgi:hypothetical protein
MSEGACGVLACCPLDGGFCRWSWERQLESITGSQGDIGIYSKIGNL